MTAIPATTAPRKTYLDHRAATKPGWTFAIVGLVSPAIGLAVYGFKQRSWAYLYVFTALFVGAFAASDAEGNLDPGAKYAMHLATGGAAALVARNNKKNAKKELGIDD